MKLDYGEDIGNIVLCDICNTNYTEKPDTGGFIFNGNAYCPVCAVRGMENIKRYSEESYIDAVCPEGKSFYQFVLDYRGGDNTVAVYSAPKGDK